MRNYYLKICKSKDFESSFDLFLEVDVLIFLFPQNLSAFLAATHEVGHDLLCRSERHVLEHLNTSVGETVCQMVRETLKLAEQDALFAIVSNSEPDCLFHRVDVVRCYEKRVCGFHLGDNKIQVLVVTLVRAFNLVPHWRLSSISHSNRPFLVHISSSDELDSQVESQRLRRFDFHWQYV